MLIILSFENERDKDAFEYLYNKYKRLMWSKAYDILKDHSSSEDAVSEAFIRVFRNMHKIDDPDSNKTVSFLVTIVKNVAITQYQRQKKAVPTDLTEFDIADDFSLEESDETKDELSGAMNLVNRLGEDLKSVFLLKYAHDLSHKEIGKLLNITENNVTVRLHRAKKKLTEWVKGVRGNE